MSQKISLIVDVLRNEPHVMILNKDSDIAVKAITEFGKSLVDKVVLLDQKTDPKIVVKTLPPGFEMTEFKDLSQKTKPLFDSVFMDESFAQKTMKSVLTGNIDNKTFLQRKNNIESWGQFGSRTPSEQSLDKFKTSIEKSKILDYKAKLFKSTSKRSEIVSVLKTNNIGFNDKTNNLISRNSTDISEYMKTKVSNHIGVGGMRRFLKNQFKSELQLLTSNHRVARRVLSISAEDSTTPKTKANNKFILAIKSKFKQIDSKKS